MTTDDPDDHDVAPGENTTEFDGWLDARLAERRAAGKVKQGRLARAAQGPLRQVIMAAKRASGLNLPQLTVLSTQLDPYRLDTATGHRDAEWFSAQFARFVPDEKKMIHLRGGHYLVCSAGDAQNSKGLPYKNDDDCWTDLEHCSKCARWLQYIPFERIVDARNAQPLLFTQGRWHVGDSALHLHAAAPLLLTPPDLVRAGVPRIAPYGGRQHEQAFRIVFYGEKSSLRDVLEPIAREVQGEVLLPTGESSDTMLYNAVARAAADGRPLIILYLADFDPSGWQMSISVARKVQAFRDVLFPKLEARVFHIGLTREQASEWKLPSTPLKPSEKRGDNWFEVWGREQTEIDAAIALAPDKLDAVIRAATRAFHDPTLQRRANAIWSTWSTQEADRYYSLPMFEQAQAEIDEANKAIGAAYEALLVAIDDAQDMQERWSDAVNELIAADPPADPPVDDVEPILAPEPESIFTTEDDYVTATRKLKARKALIGEGDEAEVGE